MTAELQAKISDLCEEGRSSLIPAMQAIQKELGFLSKKSIQHLAKKLDMPTGEIYGVATFYNQFRLIPKGKYTIKVCRGTACHVKGSSNLLSLLENELEIKEGETTKDKIFTIEAVACIGACSIAPVIMIDEKFYGNLVAEDIPKILETYKNKES